MTQLDEAVELLRMVSRRFRQTDAPDDPIDAVREWLDSYVASSHSTTTDTHDP